MDIVWWLIAFLAVFIYLRYKLSGAGLQSKLRDDSHVPELDGLGDCDIDVVGESSYQHNLEAVVGPRQLKGVRINTTAVVWFEDDNKYDKKAVCVDIRGRTVGYLSRETAREFRAYIKKQGIAGWEWRVPAQIRGGGKRDEKWLSYGVKLDLPIQGD